MSAAPERIFISIFSEPKGFIDIEVRIEQGGSFRLNLALNKEAGRFKLNLPQALSDQRCWVADKDGLRPDTKKEERGDSGE